jgi:hypothetical protein
MRSPAEVAETGLAALTGLDTPSVGALEQTIFYVSQIMQFGKLLAVFQRSPTEANDRNGLHGDCDRVVYSGKEEGIRERTSPA